MAETTPPNPPGGDHAHGHSHDADGADLAGVVMDQAFWDERYQSSNALWSGRPNAVLVSETVDLVPGRALDVGCGEGADAIWLARRGWRVTAIDISTVALERAAAHAREAGDDLAQRISWLYVDLTNWVPPASTYDLVSAQFLHAPKVRRQELHQRLAAAVSSGGSLLLVGHHVSDLQTTVPRPPVPELYFTAGDVANSLDAHEWDVVVNEARARQTLDPDGRTTTIRDAVLLARRTS